MKKWRVFRSKSKKVKIQRHDSNRIKRGVQIYFTILFCFNKLFIMSWEIQQRHVTFHYNNIIMCSVIHRFLNHRINGLLMFEVSNYPLLSWTFHSIQLIQCTIQFYSALQNDILTKENAMLFILTNIFLSWCAKYWLEWQLEN